MKATIILLVLVIGINNSYSQNKWSSREISTCDSLLCAFINENWRYVYENNYYEYKDENFKITMLANCIVIEEDVSKQPFVSCMQDMTPVDFIALLGIPNERSPKALTYYLSSIREWRDPPFYCLRIIFENGKFFCTMMF